MSFPTPTSEPTMEMPAPNILPTPTPTSAPMDIPTIASTPTPTSASIDMSTPKPFRQSGTPGESNRSHLRTMGPPLWRLFDASPLTVASRASSSWENQESQVSSSNIFGEEVFTDESSHLFSLYLSYAEKHDKEQAENWIAGADGILVFVRIRLSSSYARDLT